MRDTQARAAIRSEETHLGRETKHSRSGLPHS